jgi:hypothetical protein
VKNPPAEESKRAGVANREEEERRRPETSGDQDFPRPESGAWPVLLDRDRYSLLSTLYSLLSTLYSLLSTLYSLYTPYLNLSSPLLLSSLASSSFSTLCPFPQSLQS